MCHLAEIGELVSSLQLQRPCAMRARVHMCAAAETLRPPSPVVARDPPASGMSISRLSMLAPRAGKPASRPCAGEPSAVPHAPKLRDVLDSQLAKCLIRSSRRYTCAY